MSNRISWTTTASEPPAPMPVPWVGYAVGVLFTVLAALLRCVLGMIIDPSLHTFLVFYPAVMFAALIGGLWPGLLTTLLSVVTVSVFFLHPMGTFALPSTTDQVELVLFFVLNIGLSVVCDALRSARQRAIVDSRRARFSEQRLLVIFHQAAVGILEMNAQDEIVTANERFCMMLGYGPEQLLGKTVHELTHPEDRDTTRELLREIREGIRTYCEWEKRYLTSNGSDLWVRVAVRPLKNPDGSYLGAIGMVEDIRERRAAEQALRQSEQLFRALAESIPQVVWINDGNGKLEYINRRWKDYTGQIPGKPAANSWLEAIHPEDQQASTERWNASFETGQPFEVQHRLRNREGGYRWFLSRSLPLRDDQGRIQHWFGTSTDIDDQKRALEALEADQRNLCMTRDHLTWANVQLDRIVQERTAKLSEMVAEMEGLSYSLVHDLRAPLRAMMAYASVLEIEAGENLLPTHHEYLRRLKEASQRMDHLVTDALNYTRVLRQDFPLSPVNLGRLLKGIVETYLDFQPPRAEVTVEIADLVVQGNQAALTQVFSNLVGNAVKFVAPGVMPRVRIWSEPLVEAGQAQKIPSVGATQPSQFVRIWVEDNGIGIPSNAHEKIFEMFQRMHRAEEYPGTGIGLALVRKSLERTGGRIAVKSEPGKGSRFYVDLPLPPPTN